jgi:hypothetical protein
MAKKKRADIERMRGLVRAKKERSKQILVVSNRSDRDLQRQLAEKLEGKVTWVVHKPRRVQAAAKAVSQGRFDVVIVFTGFINHKTSDLITAAARKSNTSIVRANRGRLAAVEQAMERDLGENDDVRQTDQDDRQEPTDARVTP